MRVGTITKIEHLGDASYRLSGVNRCMGGSSPDKWLAAKVEYEAEVRLGAEVQVVCSDKTVEQGLMRRLRERPYLLTPERAAENLGFTFKL